MRRKTYRLDRSGLSSLCESLKQRGYEIYGPQVRGHAIQWHALESVDDLPAGWTTETGPSHYRLSPRPDQALFGYWTGPDSLKKTLHPARAVVARAELNGDGLRILQESLQPVKRAFLGVRACDLAAVAALDRALLGDRYVDDVYRSNRAQSFLIAVHCQDSAATCFCASMKTGPQARTGFDIALAERPDGEFLAEAGSAQGLQVIEACALAPAPPEWARQLAEACEKAGAAQTRQVNAAAALAVIEQSFDHPRWEATAARCLACGNCTSVCPTCFCVNFEERSALDMHSAERLRVWDSCFTQSFTYIHGGSIRQTPKSRYRQWLSHKLARWQAQFGVPGCTGCGRCITWCPAGIDITEEFAALEAAPATSYTTGVAADGH